MYASALSESASDSATARFVAAGSNTAAGNRKKFFLLVLKEVKKIKAAAVLTVSHWVKIFGRYVRRRDRPKEPIDK